MARDNNIHLLSAPEGNRFVFLSLSMFPGDEVEIKLTISQGNKH
jgi:hypothetical protein